MKKHIRWIVLSLAALASLAGPIAGIGRADTLYGITFSNQLITIDPTTGVGTLVGNLDTPMAGYGLSVKSGNLYTYDQTADLIRQIDPATGHTLASINIAAGNLVGEGDLAFRSDGIGFMSTGGTTAGVGLVRFDISGPTSSLVSGQPFLFDGLAFNNADILYGISQGSSDGGSKLYTINQSTGASSLVGPLNIPAGINGILGGLTFRSDGTLWAEISDQSSSTLAQVNFTTGQATTVGAIAGFHDVSGIAFLPTPGTAVPEASSFILMGPSLIGVFGFAIRKRRAQGV